MRRMKSRWIVFAGENKVLDIPEIIEKVMGRHSVKPDPDIDDIIDVDLWARK